MHGQNPYDPALLFAAQQKLGWAEEFPLMMWNPPWTLIFLKPFVTLPFIYGAKAWLAAGLGLTFCSVYFYSHDELDNKALMSILLLSSLMFGPSLNAFLLGQSSTLLVLGLCGFSWAASKKKDIAAGLFLSLLTIKPHVVYIFWLVALWWIIKERRYVILFSLMTIMGILIGLVSFSSPQVVVQWLTAVSSQKANPNVILPMQWRTASLASWIIHTLNLQGSYGEKLIFLLLPCSAILLTLTYLIRKQPSINWKKDLPLIVIISALTSPFSWIFDYSVLIVPYLFVIETAFSAKIKISQRHTILAGITFLQLVIVTKGFQMFVSHDQYFWVPLAFACIWAFAKLAITSPETA